MAYPICAYIPKMTSASCGNSSAYKKREALPFRFLYFAHAGLHIRKIKEAVQKVGQPLLFFIYHLFIGRFLGLVVIKI
jgi:hypothetical protein